MAIKQNELEKIIITKVVKDKQRMLKAMKRQDILAKKAGNWNSNEVIRKWREKGNMMLIILQ